jgi:mRNA interferase RelE/StbE
MGDYQVLFARSASKELEALPQGLAARVLERIDRLAGNPRPPGSRKLAATDALWRIRIGDYRVVYGVDDTKRIIDVVAVRHRRDAYR